MGMGGHPFISGKRQPSLYQSRPVLAQFDKSTPMLKIHSGRFFLMKDFFKTLLFSAGLLAAFLAGFSLGKEKERRKIPEFQKD
jgi:hypothetical protein